MTTRWCTIPFTTLSATFMLMLMLMLMLISMNHCPAVPPADAAGGNTTTVNVILAPENSLTPDVAVDGNGVVHMVYSLDHNAYYTQSRDNGKTLFPPIKLNRDVGVTTTMGERGPKIALGKNDSIHIAWADQWFPGGGRIFYKRYTRSLDGGRSFEPPKVISDELGDGFTLTADNNNHVLAFWHIMDERKPQEQHATWLYLVRSTDNGVTFGNKARLEIDNHTGLACSMCLLRARIGADGKVYLAFRSAVENIRDHYVLTGSPTENTFTAVRVNTDSWKIATCPMTGPELTVAPDGRALCAFMSERKVYWAVADAAITKFSLHVATPTHEKNEIYPSAIANRNGDVLFLWQVGPMSVNGTAVVKWARYTLDGTFTGMQGVLGTSFSGTKATAFVGADDNFYIVTTAQPR